MSNKSKVDAETNTRKVSESTPRAGFAEPVLREKLETAFRRFGGLPALGRAEGGTKKIIDIVLAELAALSDPVRDALVGLNGALDRYWEGNRTEAQVTLICDWQQKCQAALSNPAQPETGVRATFEAINTELDKIWDTSERAEEIDGLVKLKNIVRRALSTDEAGGVQGSEWQPIETAPKDGTPIDLWRPIADWGKHQQRLTGRWVDCYGGQDVNAWVWPTNPVEDIQSDTWLESGDYYESNEFTHWMPLPTPPRDGGVQKETPLAMRGPSHD